MSERTQRLTRLVLNVRRDLDQVAAELVRIDDAHEQDPHAGIEEEVDEVRARIDALERRVQAIESGDG